MAYGGPNSLDELPGYLADIRRGRPTSSAILEQISYNYRQIGGKSPLLAISQQQAAGVAKKLDPARFRVYLGMRHWSPWVQEVVGEMLEDGITRAVSLVLAPHYSEMSVAKYQENISDGLEMYRGHIEFEHIRSYHKASGLIEAFASRVHEGLARWPDAEQESVHVIFSAHSLPVRILGTGDPYDQQLRETAKLVADAAGLPEGRWSWSYQSAGRSPEPWLGPQLQEHIAAQTERGISSLVIIPIGFVSDHVEILYDIDVQAQQVARERGARLERPPALNTDPVFIDTLVGLIRDQASRWQPEK